MLDHIGIEVSDYKKAVEFYKAVLAPLGYDLLIEVQGYAGFGEKGAGGPIAAFWLHEGPSPSSALHFAFKAKTRQAVDAFYDAAIKAGGKDNGKPGVREMYHPNYYGAFVLDLDGRNLEAVCHADDARPKTPEELDALKHATMQLEKLLVANGLTVDELANEFRIARKEK